jgi:hypothetical protein
MTTRPFATHATAGEVLNHSPNTKWSFDLRDALFVAVKEVM